MESRDRQDSGWRKDKLGIIAPIGGGAGYKEFFRVGKDKSAAVANMIARARFMVPEAAYYLQVATSIATDSKGDTDEEHAQFCANMVGASIGVEGRGRDETLMGMTNIIAPAALSGIHTGKDGHVKRLNRHSKPVEEETE